MRIIESIELLRIFVLFFSKELEDFLYIVLFIVSIQIFGDEIR